MKSPVVANCPECGGGWEFTEFTQIAQDTYLSYDNKAVCPRCGAEFVWTKSGELSTGGDDQDTEEYTTFGDRRPKVKKVCECGCGESFLTTHRDKLYKNSTHKKRVQRRRKK